VDEGREVDGWQLIEGGAAHPRHRVLILPANLATAEFYRPMLDDPALAEAGVQALAATPPGFGGRPAAGRFAFTIDAYAGRIDALAGREGVDVIVGHSLSAQAAVEAAAQGRWRGGLVLVAPTLRARDEEGASRSLAMVSRVPVMRTAAWWAMMRAIGVGLRDELPPERHAELIAEVRRSPNRVHRRWLVAGFDHVVRHGDLTPAVVAAAQGRTVAVVRGADDRLGLSDDSRRALASAGVRVVDVPGAGHFVPTQCPEAVNAVVLDVLRRGTPA
jgi:pimeloyl-ACP methyl ester carboxylesterase